MTRINAGIPVEVLSDQHLLAEHREIKRIPNTTFKSKPTEKFTLGPGHVLFFSNNPVFTFRRYVSLFIECHKRKFNVEEYSDNWVFDMFKYDSEYTPSQEDTNIVVDRIVERVQHSNQMPRYYGNPMSKEEYIDRLLKLKK